MTNHSRRPGTFLLLLAGGTLPAQQWIPHALPPVPSAASVALRDVEGTSPSDVWVVGSYWVNHPGYSVQHSLVLHHDGNAWSIVPAPNPIGAGGPYNEYAAVKAFAPNDVWVAGTWHTVGSTWMPISDLLVAHWDGSSWTTMVTTSGSASGAVIKDIVASGPDDIWFLGRVGMSPSRALALHWDGSGFRFDHGPTLRRSPQANLEFTSGAALARNDAWFVGGVFNFLITQPYLVHANGASMATVPGATIGNSYHMRSVAARTGADVWVLGEEQIGSNLTYLLWRWNGSAWNQAPQWQGGFHAHTLHVAGGELLAGGLGGVQRWDGTAWSSETELSGYATPVVQVMGNAGSSVFAIGGAGGVPSTSFLIERIPGATVRSPCAGAVPPDSLVATALPRLGQPWSVAIGDPQNAAQLQPGSTLSAWVVSAQPAAGHPCGTLAPWAGFGGSPAELFVDLSPALTAVVDSPKLWLGPATPSSHTLLVPVVPALVGLTVYCQGALLETGATASRVVLTNAIDFVIGA